MWNFIDRFSTANIEFRKQHTYSLLIASNFDVVFTTERAYAAQFWKEHKNNLYPYKYAAYTGCLYDRSMRG
jgi:hypothetical protein